MGNLAVHEQTLQDLVEQVQAAVKRPVLHDEDTGWSADLAEADRLLQEALEQRQAAPLRRSVQLLKRLLTREPSRINERLNRTAGMLRLGQIENALAGIAERLVGAQTEGGLDSERLAQFGRPPVVIRLTKDVDRLIDAAVMLDVADGVAGQPQGGDAHRRGGRHLVDTRHADGFGVLNALGTADVDTDDVHFLPPVAA